MSTQSDNNKQITKNMMYSKTTPPRIHYIDVMRGLLMLTVVLGHSIGDVTNPVNKFILSFHMPAFFILSGMCFHPKKSDFNSLDLVKRKFRGLVWPYITLSLIGVALYWLLLAGTSKDLDVSILQTFIGIIWNDEHIGKIVTMGFWFVYDLIWITLLYILTKRINKYVRLSVSAILFLSLYYCKANFYFSSEIMRISVGFMLFTIGDIFSMHKQRFSRNNCGNVFGGGKSLCLLSMVSLLLTVIISQLNSPVLMYNNTYGNALLFICSSIFGTFFFFCLAMLIDKCKILEFVGRNTLPILLFHFYVLMISHVLLHKLLAKINNYAFPYYLLHFVFATLICCVLSLGIKKFFPWLLKLSR